MAKKWPRQLDRGGCFIEVFRFFYNYFGTLVIGRLIEGSRLMGVEKQNELFCEMDGIYSFQRKRT